MNGNDRVCLGNWIWSGLGWKGKEKKDKFRRKKRRLKERRRKKENECENDGRVYRWIKKNGGDGGDWKWKRNCEGNWRNERKKRKNWKDKKKDDKKGRRRSYKKKRSGWLLNRKGSLEGSVSSGEDGKKKNKRKYGRNENRKRKLFKIKKEI